MARAEELAFGALVKQGRVRRLEEQFRRIQELMGFADMAAVVDKLIEQQQVCCARTAPQTSGGDSQRAPHPGRRLRA